jgi:hypothetical protein
VQARRDARLAEAESVKADLAAKSLKLQAVIAAQNEELAGQAAKEVRCGMRTGTDTHTPCRLRLRLSVRRVAKPCDSHAKSR